MFSSVTSLHLRTSRVSVCSDDDRRESEHLISANLSCRVCRPVSVSPVIRQRGRAGPAGRRRLAGSLAWQVDVRRGSREQAMGGCEQLESDRYAVGGRPLLWRFGFFL